MVMLLALAHGVHAEMTVSQSNAPMAPIDGDLVALLGQERSGLDALSAGRIREIALPPVTVRTQPGRAGKANAGGKAYDPAVLARVASVKGDANFQCLATAIYFEARGESLKGQVAVAEVVLNRVDSPQFPRTICGVVNQGGSGGCQFSFTCDGRADRIREKGAWDVAARIARVMIDGGARDLTDGATYFHTPKVRPSWARRFDLTATIGSHLFYRQPITTAMN